MGTSLSDRYWVELAPQPRAIAPSSPQKPRISQLASRSTRLLAHILDTFFSVLPVVISFVLTQSSEESPATTKLRLILWIAGTLVCIILQMTLLSVRGQTVGKLVVGVRIVNDEDECNPGFYRAVVLRSIVPSLIGALPCFGFLFALVDVLWILGEDRRCLHDLIAGTKVVDV